MRVVLVEAPAPVVTPADVPGRHAADDAMVTAMIAAATANIDGPDGWLGHAIGGQVLEAFADGFSDEMRLPYGPVIGIEAVAYVDAAGVEHDLAPETYRRRGDVLTSALPLPWPTTSTAAEAVRVRYRAGYAKDEAGTLKNETPAPIKAAIVLMTVGLLTAQARDGGLRSFEAQGAFTKQFNSPELMDRVRTVTVERLLAPFRVYA